MQFFQEITHAPVAVTPRSHNGFIDIIFVKRRHGARIADDKNAVRIDAHFHGFTVFIAAMINSVHKNFFQCGVRIIKKPVRLRAVRNLADKLFDHLVLEIRKRFFDLPVDGA